MAHFEKICLDCEAVVADPKAFACTQCGGLLGFRYDYDGVAWDDRFAGNMWRYWRLLPIENVDNIITLNEGNTPLQRSRLYTNHNVQLKHELRNPTGSHKDRPLSVAINHAATLGATVSYVVSTGSTGISNAALASQAGMRNVVIMPAGTPPERVYPMYVLGAQVVAAHGDVDLLVNEVIKICQGNDLYLSSTSRASNPYQGEGNKTIAYEIVEQLGGAPDWMVVPVGGGGTISGVWRGFKDMRALGKIETLPKLVGVVPRDYNALEVALKRGVETLADFLALPFDNLPPSILVKLAHGYPPDGMDALEAIRESGGFFASVTDDQALDAMLRFGRAEGLYIEASTGVCIPVIDDMIESGALQSDETLVALICGSGFRENFVAIEKRPLQSQAVSMTDLAAALIDLGTP